MPANPKGNIEKLERIRSAWKTLKPEKSFGGMRLSEFEEYVNTCQTARAVVTEAENRLSDALTDRDAKDDFALSKAQLVKNGVLADPAEGENSALYEMMGYVRKDDKKSGLTRKKKTPATE
jgi:hypothetical protein